MKFRGSHHGQYQYYSAALPHHVTKKAGISLQALQAHVVVR